MNNILLIVKVVPKWRRSLYRNLGNKLEERGWKLHLAYDYNAQTMSNHRSSGEISDLDCYEKKLKCIYNKFDYLSRIDDILNMLKPKIVITDANPRFLTASELIIKRKKYKYKLFGWSSGFFRTKNFVIDKMRKKYFAKYDGIIAYHSKAKKFFQDDYQLDNVLLAGNGIDERLIIQELNKYTEKDIRELRKTLVDDSEIIVLFVGKLTKGKNVELILNAAKDLSDMYKFLIIGSGPEEYNLKHYISTQKINNVKFLGKIEEGINKYFQVADIFILPGLGGLALVQALHNGLPIITSLADGIALDIIEEGKNGFLSENINKNFIINSLKKLESKEIRDKFGLESARIAKKFRIEKITSRVTDFILDSLE